MVQASSGHHSGVAVSAALQRADKERQEDKLRVEQVATENAALKNALRRLEQALEATVSLVDQLKREAENLRRVTGKGEPTLPSAGDDTARPDVQGQDMAECAGAGRGKVTNQGKDKDVFAGAQIATNHVEEVEMLEAKIRNYQPLVADGDEDVATYVEGLRSRLRALRQQAMGVLMADVAAIFSDGGTGIQGGDEDKQDFADDGLLVGSRPTMRGEDVPRCSGGLAGPGGKGKDGKGKGRPSTAAQEARRRRFRTKSKGETS